MWKVISDSVRGTSHEQSGEPCQDTCSSGEYICSGESVLMVVCSDGAGSAKYAEQGSHITSDTFTQAAREWITSHDFLPNRDDILEWIVKIRTKLISSAKSAESSCIRDFASTLVAGLIAEDSAVFVQIGDGAITVLRDASYVPVFWPQSGEYANTTCFVSDDNFPESLRYCRFEIRIDELALFTDGIERLALNFTNKSVHSPFFYPLFSTLREASDPNSLMVPLHTFLRSDSVNSRTNDDKTLILATRISSADVKITI